MNRGLRARHRWMTRGIAIVLPLLFLLAVSAREDPAQMSALPSALDPSPTAPANEVLRWESADLFERVPALVQFYETASSQFGGALNIAPLQEPRLPDLLVYWSSDSAVGAVVPEDSHLLGRLAGSERRFLLPQAAATQAGSLYLYSLGHQELVDAVALKARP